MEYLFLNRMISMNEARQSGMFDEWDEVRIQAFNQHQIQLKRKHKIKLMREIEYQEGVLVRMKKTKCKPCETERQRKHIEQLKG